VNGENEMKDPKIEFAGGLNRRQLFGLGGTSLLGVALLAACSHDTPSATRVGAAPGLDSVSEPEVNDIVLLRTAASLEYNVIDAYAEIAPLLSSDFAAAQDAIGRFVDDHKAHADAINNLVVAAGGAAYTEANARIQDLYIAPALAYIGGTDAINPSPTPAEDALTVAIALENLAAATYQSVTSVLNSRDLRKAAIQIGQTEARHATILTRVLAPKLSSVIPSVDATTGAENISALTTAFGSLSSITVTIGAPNESGTRPSLNLDTPSLNSLISE
jgi:Ferritin-like domain